MVYYVAYRASKDLGNRSRIARRLRSLGCRQIRRSFWIVDEENIRTVAETLRENHPIIMKKSRDLRKPSFNEKGKLVRLGSLIVIAYRVPKKETTRKIGNHLRRSPCIRLCRGVYAFRPRYARPARNADLVDVRSFWEFIRGIDENALIISRIRVVNHEAIEELSGEPKKRVEREIKNIIERYQGLLQMVAEREIDRQHALSVALKLRKRLAVTRKVALAYEEWLRIDLSSILIKPYSTIKKVRSLLHSEYSISY